MEKGIPLPMSIFGPGGRPEQKMTRKIIKNETYKNWRLNGEFIRGPEDEPTRYNALQAGDLAVMAFDGEPVPSSLNMVLLARGLPNDAGLHAVLDAELGKRSMIALTVDDLSKAIVSASTPAEHPINRLIIDPALNDALEDAALGGERSIRRLWRQRRTGRTVSAADLAKARLNADRIGRAGEGLVNAFLRQSMSNGEIKGLEWTSDHNAIAPYDFRIKDFFGFVINLDVKSTTGPFSNDLHISLAELKEAANLDRPQYDLYRVYDLTEDGGRLRIAPAIRNFAESVLDRLYLPEGVRCDSVSVSPEKAGLAWGEEIYIARPTGDEGDEVF